MDTCPTLGTGQWEIHTMAIKTQTVEFTMTYSAGEDVDTLIEDMLSGNVVEVSVDENDAQADHVAGDGDDQGGHGPRPGRRADGCAGLALRGAQLRRSRMYGAIEVEVQPFDEVTDRLLRLLGWLYGENMKKELGLPSEWDQENWLNVGHCGTAACVAGKTVLDDGWEVAGLLDDPGFTGASGQIVKRLPGNELIYSNVETEARKLLGMSTADGEWVASYDLFSGRNNFDTMRTIILQMIADRKNND
jgi:hypothetical protein